ncbi:MAG: site-2 protease family protein [Candidatus Marsarchaeota archaeon]|nr:site-2 protease family protein [Candidatus Marsarchaeota archaeon]
MASQHGGAPRRKKPNKNYSLAVTLSTATAAFAAIAFLVLIQGNVLLRFAVAVGVLILSGRTIATANGIPNSYGLYLLGGKKGITFVERLSKMSPRFWVAFADWGLAVSFGILSYFLFGKYVSKKVIALGVITNLAILLLVFPYLPVVLSFVSIPQITSKLPVASALIGISPVAYVQGIFSSLGNQSATFYIFLASSLVGGFSLAVIMLLLFSGGIVVYNIGLFLFGLLTLHPNPGALAQTVPGVAPLIPGLTIPLVAGLITLIIILVVHEFSHGVLARIAKVRIKSIGVILLGVIPMGAFVEPDEREVRKLKESHQNRISIAGVSANMLACIVFFLLTFAILAYVFPVISTDGVLVTQTIPNSSAYGVIAPNTVILSWNNVPIQNAFDLLQVETNYTPGTPVKIGTNNGTFTLTPSAQGKLGIYWTPAKLTSSYQAVNFLYAVAALSFGLNFFIAIFNLLPLPAFDGWRIYQNKIKNKKLLRLLAFVMVVAILLNVLPWVWTIG